MNMQEQGNKIMENVEDTKTVKTTRTTTISLKIPIALKKKLEWLSELKNMSMSEYIRSLIEVEIPITDTDTISKEHPLIKFIDIFNSEDDTYFLDELDNIRKNYVSRPDIEF